MTYNINTAVFGNTFAVPSDVVDGYLKIATHNQLKVLLYFMRNISQGIDPQKISAELSLPLDEVEDALTFWQQRDVLIGTAPKEPQPKAVVINSSMPSRADVIRRGLEDESLMFLLREAQLKFGRNLKQNESSLLVSLYDDNGMDISVILLLLEYATQLGKCNTSFIRSTAAAWLKNGVETVVDAERIISEQTKQNLAWSSVCRVFGIEKRKPSEKELQLSQLWINEWQISEEMIKKAYDICIDTKGKFIMSYIATVLESWHKDGITNPEQTVKSKSQKGTSAKTDYAGYDLELFEKMLNKDD